MSYAALGAACVGMDVIADPTTGSCHCPQGWARLGSIVADAGSVANDCVDPSQFGAPGAVVAAKVVVRSAAPRRAVTSFGTPLQMGLYAGWAGIVALGGFGVSLIWKATHS